MLVVVLVVELSFYFSQTRRKKTNNYVSYGNYLCMHSHAVAPYLHIKHENASCHPVLTVFSFLWLYSFVKVIMRMTACIHTYATMCFVMLLQPCEQ